MPDDNQNPQTNGNQGTGASSSQNLEPSSASPASPQPRVFSNPRISSPDMRATIPQVENPNQPFQPLPPPTGQSPYHLTLDEVLPDKIAAIRTAGQLVFHTTGDTGGYNNPSPQKYVVAAMVNDYQGTDTAAQPAFFYHLGDVAYLDGQATDYYAQFYEPYQTYPGPIFAIPGNHDGDVSLTPFVNNFCAPTNAVTPDARDIHRHAMTQPNVYWTLLAPFVTIIGLYTNVPDTGVVQPDQVEWFVTELKNAPKDAALIVALHHPPFSFDQFHGGVEQMYKVVQQAINSAGVTPHLVLSGHVHDYQRFTHTMNGVDVSFIVAGAGGYHNLHPMKKDPNGNKLPQPYVLPGPAGQDVTLASYCDNLYGYLRITVTQQTLKGEYFAVGSGTDPSPDPSTVSPTSVDHFTMDLTQHRLVP